MFQKILPIKTDVLHIHGSISKSNTDIVLGIDNEEQIHVPYSISDRGRRGFIKPVFNSQYDVERVENARAIIKNAGVICIYGMSLGDSDLRWRNLLFDVLDSEHDTHIFIYQYDLVGLTNLTADERLDMEEQRKRELFVKWGIPENKIYMDRIHIPCGRNIFNINQIVNEIMSKTSKGTVMAN